MKSSILPLARLISDATVVVFDNLTHTATIAAVAGGGGLGDIIVNQATYNLSGVVGASLVVSRIVFQAALSRYRSASS